MKIALSCGDPAGVGPEIISKFLNENPLLAKNCLPIGPQRWLDKLPVAGIPVGKKDFLINPGTPSPDGQHIALEAIECAAAETSHGNTCAVVTAPINKAGLQSIGYPFPGQTEFFASRWGGVPVMAFAGGRLNVVLATWHIPFLQVPELLNFSTLRHSVLQAHTLIQKLKKNKQPKIAVCGLNPHAGENGILGKEEKETLNPILEKLVPEFPTLCPCCVPADTAFFRQLQGEFDAIVALYHDQALAPVKTLEFEESVNLSLGLKYLRTSPDHGTAYNIAGTGKAQTRSFYNAVSIAMKMSNLI